MERIKFIALKELFHILRDPRSLIIAIVMPIMMTFLYGYAINLDIENITIAVIDYDQSVESRNLVGDFYTSGYFSEPKKPVSAEDPKEILRSSGATAVLVIKPGFAEAVKRRETFSLGMIIDGSDNNLSAAVKNYSSALINQYVRNQLPPNIEVPMIDVSVKIFYNPDLKSSHFFVPGLVSVILLMISALLTSITIAREKETGTMEQLLTAPVTPLQILMGKTLPYIALAFVDGLLVLLLAKILFDIPFVGSSWLLLLFGFVYVSTALALGILISAVANTQQVAMMLAQLATLLPSVMLSGFIFAIKNMPLPLQLLSHIVPARYFNVILRGITLKGAGLDILYVQGLALLGLLTLFIFVASKKFKTRIG